MLQLLASEYRPLIQDILAYSICACALIWGMGPERAIAAIWLVIFEWVPGLYELFWGVKYQLASTDMFLATLDVAAGLGWVLIALNANRNYPMLIAALQLLVIAAHLARGAIDSIAPVAYALMVTAPGWLQLLLLGLGLARHLLRTKRYGSYREWRASVEWNGLFPSSRKSF